MRNWNKTKLGCYILQGVFIFESIFIIPFIWTIPGLKMIKKILKAETDEEQYQVTDYKKFISYLGIFLGLGIGAIAGFLILLDIRQNNPNP